METDEKSRQGCRRTAQSGSESREDGSEDGRPWPRVTGTQPSSRAAGASICRNLMRARSVVYCPASRGSKNRWNRGRNNLRLCRGSPLFLSGPKGEKKNCPSGRRKMWIEKKRPGCTPSKLDQATRAVFLLRASHPCLRWIFEIR